MSGSLICVSILVVGQQYGSYLNSANLTLISSMIVNQPVHFLKVFIFGKPVRKIVPDVVYMMIMHTTCH